MSVFTIGLTGLAAAQAGMQTTGHNISNVNTPGFSRQRVEQTTAPIQNSDSGFIGKGTAIASIERVYSDAITGQVCDIDSQLATSQTLSDEIARITGLLGDESSGLSTNVSDFFAAFQAVAANPSDLSARATLISAGNTLVERLSSTDTELRRLRGDANESMTGLATDANRYATQIADLNQRIAVLGATGNSPNDLLDQRDQALRELSKIVRVNVAPQPDGQVNVFLASGQSLVVAGNAFEFSTQADPASPGDVRLTVKNAANALVPVDQRSVGSGSLAAYVDLRDRLITGAQNAIGRISAVLSSQVNAQHQLGVDRNGLQGGLFFTAPGAPVVAANANNNPASGTVATTITDYTQLRATDYTVRYTGSSYTVMRMSDGVVQTFSSLPQTVDGAIQISLSGSLAAGDSFLVQPVRSQVSNLRLAVSDPSSIAAGSPVTSAASTSNLGNGTITAPTVTGSGAFAATSYAIRFNVSGGTTTYDLVNTTTSTTISSGNAYTAGGTISYGGWSVQVSGTPRNGDAFTVTPNANGTGDNRNARAIAAIQSAGVVRGGTLSDAYGQLIGETGMAARDADLRVKSQSSALKSAEEAQSAVSGVNLDEEAANLLKYQQAYQASAKFIQIASSLFDDLLNAAR